MSDVVFVFTELHANCKATTKEIMTGRVNLCRKVAGAETENSVCVCVCVWRGGVGGGREAGNVLRGQEVSWSAMSASQKAEKPRKRV